MLFSVLVPVYNVELYLAKCLDSILCQDFTDYEVILVDDGSTDNSGSICDDYQKKYPSIVHVIHKENQGLILARRTGIQNAHGDYCIFVDSDDYVSKELFISLSEYIHQHSTDIVLYSFTYFDGDLVGEKKKPIAANGQEWSGEEKKELYELLATSSTIDAMFIKAIKTSLLKDDPTDYSLYSNKNMSEDTLQSVYPLTAAKLIGFLDKSLYYYRYNPMSISRNYSVETMDNKRSNHVYDMIMDYLPKWGLDNSLFVRRVNARWFNETLYFFSKSYENAKKRKQRNQVLAYNWDSMIPCLDIDSYSDYVNQHYLKIYCWYKKKRYTKLNAYFLKNKLYQKYKNKKKKIHKQ